jgi:hypothetical protein
MSDSTEAMGCRWTAVVFLAPFGPAMIQSSGAGIRGACLAESRSFGGMEMFGKLL